LSYPSCPQPTDQESKLRKAKEYRELAERGMCPRKYQKLAERLEKEVENGE
jgi:hypothetical protein